MTFVSIAQHENEFAGLEEAAKFAALLRPKVDDERGNWQHKKLLIPSKLDEPRSAFADIAAEFSKFVAMDDLTVLVSQVHPMQMNPLLSQGAESLLAMLILAFPEVRWFFGTIRGYGQLGENTGRFDDFRKAHGLSNLFRPAQSSLFDGAGLRDWVRQQMQDHKESADQMAYLPRRIQLAVALDEETDYAQLHAYVAFRFGFRGLPLSTKSQAVAVLGSSSAWKVPTVAFEDIFLNLPDAGHGYSNLGGQRHIDFPKLESEEAHRIFVSSGQRLEGDEVKWAANRAYIADQRAHGVRVKTLHKPHAGMFRIWEKSGLSLLLSWSEADGKLHCGVGDKFVWPPRWNTLNDQSQRDGGGHSCPGILVVIAQCLIDRAECLFDGAHTIADGVRGAVLTTDALELLGGKTPTMAVAALTLKHQFEVLAECQFSGVEYHFPVRQRLTEISRDMASISRWFHPSQRKRARLNGEMTTVSELVKVFRSYGQFDEEQTCMNRVRRLHNTLWMRANPPRYLLWPVIRYIEFLLGSFARFVFVLALWILLFTWLYVENAHHGGWAPGLQDAITSFFSIGQPFHQDALHGNGLGGAPYIWTGCAAILLGFIHLGVFISHLYTVVSRK